MKEELKIKKTKIWHLKDLFCCCWIFECEPFLGHVFRHMSHKSFTLPSMDLWGFNLKLGAANLNLDGPKKCTGCLKIIVVQLVI